MAGFDLDSAQPIGGAPTAAPAPSDNVFDLATAKPIGQAQTLQAAQGVAVANSEQSADAAGRAAGIAKQIGAPQAAVETDLPRYEAQAKAQNNAQILSQSPRLADWVANNPDSARVAQDDFDGMSQLEGLTSAQSAQALTATKDMLTGLAKGVGSSFTSSALALNRAVGGGLSLLDKATGTDAGDWWYQRMIEPALANRQALAEPATAPFGVKAADTVGNMLGLLAQVALTGPAGAEAQTAEAAPGVAQAVGQTVAHGARAMAFPALTSAVNTGKDVYDQTGDMAQAIKAAQMSYATTTLGGIVPLGAEGSLAYRLATGAASGVATGEVSRQAMNLVMPQQEGFDPEQTILSGLSGAMLSGVMGRSPLHDAVQQAYQVGLDAETAERGGATVQQISQIAQASKLRTHDPEAFRNYVQQVSEDGPVSNVYVDGKMLADALHQSAVDPSQIPGLPDRLNEAVATGGDVQIPIADYATHIAGTDLDKVILPELKTEEGGMTYSEGQAFYQNARDEMQERANGVVDETTNAGTTQKELGDISDSLTSQIAATGRYPANVGRASIEPAVQFYRTMSERMGISPAELFDRYPLRIVGEDMGVGLQQSERGAFNPDTNTIALLKDADLSTALHESGHFFLSTLGDLAGREDAPQQIKDDMQSFLTWAGGKDLADWQGRTLEQQRTMHEKFARGFESYLMEGKAPTIEMQSLFSRFRSWLMNVYRNMTAFHGAEPNDEMRGVFDRMLASDEAIQRAEQVRGYLPLDVKAAGASDAQQAAYARQGEQATQDAIRDMQAKSIKDMQWMSKARGKIIREMQRQHDVLRDEVREKVALEVMDQPVNLARTFLETGESTDPRTGDRVSAEEGYKLNSDALKRMYAEDTYPPDLTKLRGLTAKGGMHPDDVADLFGYRSGDDLVRDLINAEKPKAATERLTDERMLQEHGELTDPQAIEDAANLAVANHARARFMATGLKILSNSDIPATELAKAAQATAERMIAGKRVLELNPRQYEVAEAKANREAITKAPKDPKGAVESQRQALLSNRLARAAREAQAEVDKIVAEQKQYDKASIRKKMDLDVLEQIDALRERFDFRRNPPDENQKTAGQKSLSMWIRSQQDLGYSPLVNPDMTNPAVRMPYREMTVEQIRGFRDTIHSLETIARARKSVTVEGQQRDLASVVDELVAKMKEKPDQFQIEDLVEKPRSGVDNPMKVALDRVSSFLRATAAELKPQQFKANQFDAQEILGPFTRTMFDRVFSANYQKVDMLKSLSDYFGNAVKEKLGQEWQDRLTEEVPNNRLLDADLSKEFGPKVYRRLTRGDMLGIARNVGNESNFEKLTKGMDWDPRDVWLFLHDNMTEKDWQATQITWDAFEQHWPEMVEMNKRLGNTSPDRVEPRPFQTKFGEMKGGYAPIDYDPIRSRLGARKQDSAAIDPSEGLFGKGYYRADTTTNGSLNGRIEGYFDRVNLDYHSLEKRLHDTVHDLAYREALIDVHKILMNRDFAKQFKLSNGPEQYKSMQRWLGNLANSQNMEDKSSRLVAIMSSARRAIVANGIALRISTVLKHGGSAALKSTGYFSGGGQKYFAARMAAIGLNHSAEVEGAIEKFPEIRARLMQQDRDYRQTSASLFQPESLHAKAERFGHSMVAWSDMMTAVPTAWAAYDRAITEGIPKNRGGTGQPMSEADAISYANQIVREAHGSNIEASRSMILAERNEAIKMFTTLYGFMNNTLGQNMDIVDKLRTNGFSKPEVLSRYLMAMIVPALWAGVLAKPDKKEGVAKWAMGAIGGEYASMVPMMRDAWSAIQGYSSAGMPAYMSALGAIAKPVEDIVKSVEGKPVKAPIKDFGNAIGLAIPGAGQVGTTIQYAADVKSGKQQPKNVVDVARGLALGQGNQ
ncbi:hypothetical protein [Paraburkholderia phenazinium]|uniref:Large polyvalent protein associated domain-containing protein n=1 Tax=Paraburkholderia phenazinium TaxID=60549 RepID=A0A1N6KP96_9BURK|nr:hypothetical protein [Paraburkholderia phenazinium]SIO58422.1 hypothetical protein SAMN05444165_4139 [Paraburkholderia phenazinium]